MKLIRKDCANENWSTYWRVKPLDLAFGQANIKRLRRENVSFSPGEEATEAIVVGTSKQYEWAVEKPAFMATRDDR